MRIILAILAAFCINGAVAKKLTGREGCTKDSTFCLEDLYWDFMSDKIHYLSVDLLKKIASYLVKDSKKKLEIEFYHHIDSSLSADYSRLRLKSIIDFLDKSRVNKSRISGKVIYVKGLEDYKAIEKYLSQGIIEERYKVHLSIVVMKFR